MTKPKSFITSVSVEVGRGPHDYVNVFIRGQNVGTLVVGKGDAAMLKAILMREPERILDHPKAETGTGAPAQPRNEANQPGGESRHVGAAAGAQPTYRLRESERPPA